jgi:hypothetical protein
MNIDLYEFKKVSLEDLQGKFTYLFATCRPGHILEETTVKERTPQKKLLTAGQSRRWAVFDRLSGDLGRQSSAEA